MKLIIIDGPDNTGKDTIINHLQENGKLYEVIHCSKPLCKEDPFVEQTRTYNLLVENVIDKYNANVYDAVFFNRFYPGEYVYGQIYRNGDKDKICGLISELEHKLLDNIGIDNVYYIQILSTSDKLLQKNDDNLSLSNAKIELIHQEQQLFKEAFNYSIIPNKKIVYVNEDGTNNFRNINDIINEIKDFLEK